MMMKMMIMMMLVLLNIKTMHILVRLDNFKLNKQKDDKILVQRAAVKLGIL